MVKMQWFSRIVTGLYAFVESVRLSVYCSSVLLEYEAESTSQASSIIRFVSHRLITEISCGIFICLISMFVVKWLRPVILKLTGHGKIIKAMKLGYVLLLSVPAYVLGKWIVLEFSLMGFPFDGLTDVVGLSSGWYGVGVLWGGYGLFVWLAPHILCWKSFRIGWISAVATVLVVVNIVILPSGRLFASPLEIRMPCHLYRVLNDSSLYAKHGNWTVLSDGADRSVICYDPIGVSCFGRNLVLKEVGILERYNHVLAESERFYLSRRSDESVVRTHVLGDDFSIYHYESGGLRTCISEKEAKDLMSISEQRTCTTGLNCKGYDVWK